MALAVVCAAQGDQIGINFVGGSTAHGVPADLGAAESAGWMPQRFWNNAQGAAGNIGPEGDGGGTISAYYSGFRVSWVAGDGTGSTPIADAGPNNRLMKGYLASGASPSSPTTIQATGVPAGMVARGYAVAVYFDGANGSVEQVTRLTFSVPGGASKTLYGQDPTSVDFRGAFALLPSNSTTDLGSRTPVGNVALFNGVHADSFSLSVQGAVNAIQILEAQVANQPPEVTLAAEGTPHYACLPQTLTATVSDDVGLSKVEFFQGSQKIGEAASAPWQVSWKVDALGDFVFSARATDSYGVSTTSNPITLAMVPPPPRQLIAYGILKDGQCEIGMGGEPGRTYQVEASANGVDWAIVGTMTNDRGLLLYREPATRPVRIYRVRQP